MDGDKVLWKSDTDGEIIIDRLSDVERVDTPAVNIRPDLELRDLPFCDCDADRDCGLNHICSPSDECEIPSGQMEYFGPGLCTIDPNYDPCAIYPFADNSCIEQCIVDELGDINDDGDIDVTDIILQINTTLGISSNLTPCQQWAADVNQDGLINVIDIIQNVSTIITTPICDDPEAINYQQSPPCHYMGTTHNVYLQISGQNLYDDIPRDNIEEDSYAHFQWLQHFPFPDLSDVVYSHSKVTNANCGLDLRCYCDVTVSHPFNSLDSVGSPPTTEYNDQLISDNLSCDSDNECDMKCQAFAACMGAYWDDNPNSWLINPWPGGADQEYYITNCLDGYHLVVPGTTNTYSGGLNFYGERLYCGQSWGGGSGWTHPDRFDNSYQIPTTGGGFDYGCMTWAQCCYWDYHTDTDEWEVDNYWDAVCPNAHTSIYECENWRGSISTSINQNSNCTTDDPNMDPILGNIDPMCHLSPITTDCGLSDTDNPVLWSNTNGGFPGAGHLCCGVYSLDTDGYTDCDNGWSGPACLSKSEIEDMIGGHGRSIPGLSDSPNSKEQLCVTLLEYVQSGDPEWPFYYSDYFDGYNPGRELEDSVKRINQIKPPSSDYLFPDVEKAIQGCANICLAYYTYEGYHNDFTYGGSFNTGGLSSAVQDSQGTNNRPLLQNYNASDIDCTTITNANNALQLSCKTPILEDLIEGCTDDSALNFDPEANFDNNSCEYPCPEGLYNCAPAGYLNCCISTPPENALFARVCELQCTVQG
jgi:hypothetical protein